MRQKYLEQKRKLHWETDFELQSKFLDRKVRAAVSRPNLLFLQLATLFSAYSGLRAYTPYSLTNYDAVLGYTPILYRG